MSTLTITIIGRPAAQGSKRLLNRRTGMMAESARRVAPWRSDVRSAAQNHAPYGWDRSGPMSVILSFYFARPKSHYTTKGDLRPSAPEHLITRVGDIDKLCRAMLDGLSSVIFDDDAQVVQMIANRCYADRPDPERAVVTINRLV